MANKQDENPIDPDQVADNPGLMEYAHNVGSAVIKPEDKGRIKGRAMAAMTEQTNRQLKQLYDQMQTLANQAKELKSRVEVSEKIYRSEMGFEPLIGHTYFLYQRANGSFVLSMVAPDSWGKSMPFEQFEAKVTLLSDHTWEVDDTDPTE